MGYKTRIWLIAGAIGLCILLYFAPKKAVDGDKPSADFATKPENLTQDFSIEKFIVKAKTQYRPAQLSAVNKLEARLKESSKPSVELIDSIARAWDDLKQPGISANYFEKKAEIDQAEKSYVDAAYRYFDAYKAAEDSIAKSAWVQRAINAYQKVLELNPENLDAKTDLGVCYAEGTSEPMKGIMLLRDVVKENPKHENAQLNLGFLSVKSGQYDKAMERFDKVLELNPKRFEIYVYKGETALQMGNKDKALDYFNTFMNASTDDKMKQQVSEYINELKKQQ